MYNTLPFTGIKLKTNKNALKITLVTSTDLSKV